MNKYSLLLFSFFLIQTVVFAQSSWKSPQYKPEAYRKVIVLAKTSNELAKRQIEDAAVKVLKEKGIEAIPAYATITAADLVSEQALIDKADGLGVDALLVYTVTGNNSQYKNKPSVNASLGVPVRVGIFRGFLGGNVPLAGGSKTVKTVQITASFYNRTSKLIQWSFPLSGVLKNDTNKLANSFAKSTVNAMIKDKLFLLN